MNFDEWKSKNKKGRNYSHFDSKVSLDKVFNYICNPERIEKHGFYPFIHYTKTFNKYNKVTRMKSSKKREICYSAHIDRYIYQYYGYKLNELYNERVVRDRINKSSIGYRNNLKKNNIHFAKEVIDFIREQINCYVIIGDFTEFFENLDHIYLKKMLCDLLSTKQLPSDYYAVYKNITKYSTWDMDSILRINGLENNSTGIEELNKLDRALSKEKFKEFKKCSIKKHEKNYGIPQGSAISAILSNIYMLVFDKKIHDYIEDVDGLYMRYSDDFIIVLPIENKIGFKEEFNFIQEIINSIPHLKLQSEKTQIYKYSNGLIVSCNELNNVPNGKDCINYLGFTFDGSKVTIRDKTISKYYYRMYRKLKTITKSDGISKYGNRISNKNIYEKYSI